MLLIIAFAFFEKLEYILNFQKPITTPSPFNITSSISKIPTCNSTWDTSMINPLASANKIVFFQFTFENINGNKNPRGTNAIIFPIMFIPPISSPL